jgi:hypothetical protein
MDVDSRTIGPHLFERGSRGVNDDGKRTVVRKAGRPGSPISDHQLDLAVIDAAVCRLEVERDNMRAYGQLWELHENSRLCRQQISSHDEIVRSREPARETFHVVIGADGQARTLAGKPLAVSGAVPRGGGESGWPYADRTRNAQVQRTERVEIRVPNQFWNPQAVGKDAFARNLLRNKMEFVPRLRLPRQDEVLLARPHGTTAQLPCDVVGADAEEPGGTGAEQALGTEHHTQDLRRLFECQQDVGSIRPYVQPNLFIPLEDLLPGEQLPG